MINRPENPKRNMLADLRILVSLIHCSFLCSDVYLPPARLSDPISRDPDAVGRTHDD
jgi:hypothetical protein